MYPLSFSEFIKIRHGKYEIKNLSTMLRETLFFSKNAREVYENLKNAGVEVLFDDRIGFTPGEKFADCDLVGIPYRVVVSARSMKENGVEIKKRTEEKGKVVSYDELLNLLIK